MNLRNVFLMLVFLFACSEKESPLPEKNVLIIDGVTYPLSHLYLRPMVFAGSQVTPWSVSVMSKNAVEHNGNVSGSDVDMINFSITLPVPNNPAIRPEGEFVLGDAEFSFVNAITGYTLGDFNTGILHSAIDNEGELTITYTGSSATVLFTGRFGFESVTCRFTGPFTQLSTGTLAL